MNVKRPCDKHHLEIMRNMAASLNKPQNAVILILGTPSKVALTFGNPKPYLSCNPLPSTLNPYLLPTPCRGLGAGSGLGLHGEILWLCYVDNAKVLVVLRISLGIVGKGLGRRV